MNIVPLSNPFSSFVLAFQRVFTCLFSTIVLFIIYKVNASASITMIVYPYNNACTPNLLNDTINPSREGLVIRMDSKTEYQDIVQLIFTHYLGSKHLTTPEIEEKYYELIQSLGNETYAKIEPLLTTLLGLTSEVSFTEGFNAYKMIIRS